MASPLRTHLSRLLSGPLLASAVVHAVAPAQAAEPPAIVCLVPAPESCALPASASVTGVLSGPHHVHSWALPLPAAATLRVTLTGLAVDFDLHVYGPDGQLAGESLNEGTEDDTVIVENAAPGGYVVYVNSARGLASDTPYQLIVSTPDLPAIAPDGAGSAPATELAAQPASAPAEPIGETPAARPAERRAIAPETAAGVTSLRLARGHGARVQDIAVYPDGRRLASAAGDGVVKVWDVPALAEARSTIAGRTSAEAVAVSPDGKVLAAATDDGRVRLWDAAPTSMHERYLVEPAGGPVRALAFSPDGRWLATSSQDARVRLWDVSGERPQRPARTFDHKMVARSLAFAPSGKLLVTGSDDGTARVWDTSSNGTEVRGLQMSGPVRDAAISGDGRYVAAASERTVTVWLLETGREVHTVEPGAGTHAVAFAPGGRLLALGGADRSIRLLETESGRELRRLTGHGDAVQALAFTPDGRLLLSGARDGAIGVWGAE
jgi:WD40 repeat protein